jgi:hypothetical protein
MDRASWIVEADPHYLYGIYKASESRQVLRFGQFVCNYHCPNELQPWPELYYASTPVALKMLEDIYYANRWNELEQ